MDTIYFDEDACCVRAHAKLNVTLEVLGRRDDGYHDVSTVMQTLELHDTIRLTSSVSSNIDFTCTSAHIDGSDNLAIRAAKLLQHRFGVSAGVHIELCKEIPIAAGLGGGSSDAAAVLVALSRLWRLSISRLEMIDLAATLGSDVAFFLFGGLALCQGRGERVTPLPAYWPRTMGWLLLVKPSLGVSTSDAYEGLPSKYHTDGSHTRTLCDRLEHGGGFDLDAIKNTVTSSVVERYPEIARTKHDMLAAGAQLVELCGTGSTLFAPFERLDSALEVLRRLASGTPHAAMYLTQPYVPR